MKTALRAQLLSQRLALSETIIQHYEMSLIKQIRALPTYQLAKRIGLYMPIKKEPNLLALMQDDKWFYVPKVKHDSLIYVAWKADIALEKSPLGILEPLGNIDESHLLDVLIIPALALDDHGHRLGFGKGYFDRFLKSNRPACVIGVIYPFQKIKDLEITEADQPVDIVLIA